MLSDLIDQIGLRVVARQLNVAPSTVHKWKCKGRLPVREGQIHDRRERYEQQLAQLADMPLEGIRAMTRPGE